VKHEKLKHQPKKEKNDEERRTNKEYKPRRRRREPQKEVPISEWVATVHG
jgi:hypothetical protein